MFRVCVVIDYSSRCLYPPLILRRGGSSTQEYQKVIWPRIGLSERIFGKSSSRKNPRSKPDPMGMLRGFFRIEDRPKIRSERPVRGQITFLYSWVEDPPRRRISRGTGIVMSSQNRKIATTTTTTGARLPHPEYLRTRGHGDFGVQRPAGVQTPPSPYPSFSQVLWSRAPRVMVVVVGVIL